MKNKRILADRLTEYFILSRFTEIDDSDVKAKTAHEINSQRERAIDYYHNNRLFHNRIQRDVAMVIEIVGQTPDEGEDE